VNFAAVQKLPVLFLCENNLYSVYSPLSVRQPEGRKIYEMVSTMGLRTGHIDGTDPLSTYQAISESVERIRNGHGPELLEITAYRWREHCGPNYDNNLPYRSEEEFQSWKSKDPVNRLQDEMLESGALTADILSRIDEEIDAEIEAAFKIAIDAPYPESDTAYKYEYAE